MIAIVLPAAAFWCNRFEPSGMSSHNLTPLLLVIGSAFPALAFVWNRYHAVESRQKRRPRSARMSSMLGSLLPVVVSSLLALEIARIRFPRSLQWSQKLNTLMRVLASALFRLDCARIRIPRFS